MNTKYLIANWKMNPPTRQEAMRLWNDVKRGVSSKKNPKIIICPPHPYLSLFSVTNNIALGAQDCFWKQDGAFTGEVSPRMLKGLGCEYVIVGHSERREYMGEDDEMINRKLKAALAARLRPVFAIGEKVRETFDSRGRHTNELDPIVEKQLVGGLAGIPRAKARSIIVVYEPVWAISKGNPNHKSANVDDVLTAVLFIRKILARLYSRSIAESIPVLYGGSANGKNLAGFLKAGNADGALVGGASLDASEFRKMIHNVEG